MPTFILISYLLIAIVILIVTALSLYLVYKLWQEKGAGHAILGFFIFPYAYIWGWIHAKRLQMIDVMVTLTIMLGVSFILPILTTFFTLSSGLQTQLTPAAQSGTYVSSEDGNGNVSVSFTSSEPVVMGTIPLGGQVSGNIEDAFDLQDWTFQGSAGQSVTIQCAGAGELRPDIKLLDPDGTWIESSEFGETENIAQIINFTLPSNGTYTIRIESWDLDGGQYTLSLK